MNAARGVAMQVKNAVSSLCNNFNQAVTPQINKSYAGGDVTYMHKLIFASSKYTYYLLFVMCLPVMLKAKTLLGSRYTRSFCSFFTIDIDYFHSDSLR